MAGKLTGFRVSVTGLTVQGYQSERSLGASLALLVQSLYRA